jgi:hypothetical protein
MSRTCRLLALCGAVALSLAACARGGGAAPPPPPAQAPQTPSTPPAGAQPATPEAQTIAAFQERMKAYIQLRSTVRKGLPAPVKEATPEQIHAQQLALAAGIRKARGGAKPGDVFEPEVQKVVRALMARVFGGPEGTQLKADIMDENPGRIRMAVNDRYPDGVPLSMVPPPVLAGLPTLPPELEYRFLGRALILLDTEAHLIVDFMDDAIP